MKYIKRLDIDDVIEMTARYFNTDKNNIVAICSNDENDEPVFTIEIEESEGPL